MRPQSVGLSRPQNSVPRQRGTSPSVTPTNINRRINGRCRRHAVGTRFGTRRRSHQRRQEKSRNKCKNKKKATTGHNGLQKRGCKGHPRWPPIGTPTTTVWMERHDAKSAKKINKHCSFNRLDTPREIFSPCKPPCFQVNGWLETTKGEAARQLNFNAFVSNRLRKLSRQPTPLKPPRFAPPNDPASAGNPRR